MAAPILPRLPNFRATPKIVRDCILIIIGSHILCEVPSLIYEISPKFAEKEVNPFLAPGFKGPIQLCWYLKFLFNEIAEVCAFYCLAKVSAQYSNNLFLAIFIFFVYHVIDLLMYIWDFKTAHYLFFDLLWTAVLLIRRAVKPFKPETITRIKSLF